MDLYGKDKMRNCGLCGETTCEAFYKAVVDQEKDKSVCPYTTKDSPKKPPSELYIEPTDIHGNRYDFVINAMNDEPSTRKIIQPLRPDIVEKLEIKEGDFVQGRPMGAGCPVTHVLQVYKVDYTTGLLYTWVVGPLVSRKEATIDIKAYSMIGFEGIISHVNNEPKIGMNSKFLPSFCMLRLNHTGLVNTIYKTRDGTVVRIEGISI